MSQKIKVLKGHTKDMRLNPVGRAQGKGCGEIYDTSCEKAKFTIEKLKLFKLNIMFKLNEFKFYFST